MKKLLSLALALVVAASFAVTAVAEDAANVWTLADGQAITVTGIGGDCGDNGGAAGNEAILELTFDSTVAGLDFTGVTAENIAVIASQRSQHQSTDREITGGVTVTTAEANKLVVSTTYTGPGSDNSGGFTWGNGYYNYVVLDFTDAKGNACVFVVGAEYASGELALVWDTYTTDTEIKGNVEMLDRASSVTIGDATYAFGAEAAESTEDTTAPAESTEETTAPAESEETTAPAESEETTAPAESEETTAPAESETTAPAETVDQAAQTFDFGIIAAAAAVVSLAGFAISKKH